MAGSLAMGSSYFDRPQDLTLARQVTEACFLSYRHSVTGIGPEMVKFSPHNANGTMFKVDPDTFYNRRSSDTEYILRPGMGHNVFFFGIIPDAKETLLIFIFLQSCLETIESVWILYRMTGEMKYQDMAWEMFEVGLGHTIVVGGGMVTGGLLLSLKLIPLSTS